MKTSISILISLLLGLSVATAHARDVRIPKISNDRDQVIQDILEKVFEAQRANVNIVNQAERTSDSRMAEDLRNQKLDVIWGGMGSELEETALPVRVPIFKGIQGHRIFSIHRDMQSAFSQVKTFEDLKRFDAGSGMGWGDTAIIEASGLPLVTTTKGANLWPMLDGGRFDYFPLAIHEPWGEIAARPELDLVVERDLMLVYPFAMYLYVHKDNRELHEIIFNGMNKMIDDGSYDSFLFSSPMFKQALISADVSKRTVIRIPNPFMHPATPVKEAKYWLDPKKLSVEDLRAL